MDLLKGGLGPFVEREFKEHVQGPEPRASATRYLGDDRLQRTQSHPGAGTSAALLKLDVGGLERRLPPDPRARRAQPRQRTARPPQQVGAPGSLLQRRRLPRPRLRRPPAHRRVGAPGRRSRQDEDGASAAALRRAGAQREAQERRHRHRGRGRRRPEALARGRHPAQRRGQRPLPAGRVRRRPLAGPPRRGHRRIPRTRSSSSAAPT